MVPALLIICRNTHKIAVAADREITQKEGRLTNAKLQNAVQILQDSYSKTFNDRTDFVVRGRRRLVSFVVDTTGLVIIYRFLVIATNWLFPSLFFV